MRTTLLLALLLSKGCGPEPEATAGVCEPVADDCGFSYYCCSDDPSAIDLNAPNQPVLPSWHDDDVVPLFSGVQNEAGYSGVCAYTYGSASTHVRDNTYLCPSPCDPTWSAAQIEAICNAGECCPSRPLAEADCVLDPTLGTSGCWRPATGADIIGLGGLEATDWSPSAHATHQDPGGEQCQALATNLGTTFLADYGLTPDEFAEQCLRRLTVADRRGLCLDRCPDTDAEPDACAGKNVLEGREAC